MHRRVASIALLTVGLMLAGSQPGSAVPGTRELVTIGDSFTVRGVCRFPVLVEETGQLGIRTHVASDGAVTFIAETPQHRHQLHEHEDRRVDHDPGRRPR